MMNFLSAFFAIVFAIHADAADAQAGPADAAGRAQGLVVVELFTSQGCPMCPGANALLADLGEMRPDTLALAYGVDYWDVYGWSDTFAMAAFTARQQAYVDAGEAHRVYTPHFVINGAPEKLRYGEARVRAAVDAAEPLQALIEPAAPGEPRAVRISGPARSAPAAVWMALYQPGVDTVQITDGPNAGREMTHYNMVRAIEPLGAWSGGAEVFDLPAARDGLAAAILVQDGPGGRILAAARID